MLGNFGGTTNCLLDPDSGETITTSDYNRNKNKARRKPANLHEKPVHWVMGHYYILSMFNGTGYYIWVVFMKNKCLLINQIRTIMLILQRGQYDKIAESVQFTYSHKSTVLQAIKKKAVNLLLCNPKPLKLS